MSKIIKNYKVTGKINKYDIVNKEDTSAVIMNINNICCVLVEDVEVINSLSLTKDMDQEYELFGILKNSDKEFNKYLIDVFGKKLVEKYTVDKILIIRRLNTKE